MNEKLKRGRNFLLSDLFISDRTRLFTVGALVTNFAVGIVKIAIGSFYLSFFWGITGVYNIILGVVKMYALRRYNTVCKLPEGEARDTSERGGIIHMAIWTIAASFLFFAFAVVTTFWLPESAEYGIIPSLFVATSAFSKLVFGIIGSVKAGKRAPGIIANINVINVADGFVALALTQRALLFMEGTENAVFYSGIGGIVLGAVALCVAGFMLLRARKKRADIVS
jgi:hypothetical protein